jgi:voltage-gated potassium channel
MQEHEQSGGPPLDQSGAGAPARETAAASRTRVRPSPTPGEQNPHPHPNRLRQRVFEIVEVGREEDRASQIFDTSLTILILLNVVAFAIETVPSIEAAYGPQLLAFEVFSVAVFTIEYVLRIWSAVEVPFLSRLSPLRARLKFASRPYLIVDLLAIAPFYVGTLLGLDLRALRLLRLFRFLKLARYSPALHTIVRVLINERRSLMGAGLLMLTAVLFASTGIYYIEREAQPETLVVPQVVV